MYEVLIREAEVRFGLGEKGQQLLQILLAYMTDPQNGGLMGFLEKFKAAGLGPVIQSWLGGGPSAQPISNSQLETVLGASGGLLSLATGRLGLARDSVTSALGYLLPAVVGKLTPGGSLPSSLPAEIAQFAAQGRQLLDAPAPVADAASAAGGGLVKWLPWVVVALAALFALSYFGNGKPGTETAPPQVAASAPASAASEAATPASDATPAASEAATAASGASAASEPPAAQASAAAAAEPPAGAGVVALQMDGLPALQVYFDSGKTDVGADFAAQSKALVDYLQAHADVQAVLSGFSDPSGNSLANDELAKSRAKAVQAALVAEGVAADRTVLEKPADAPAGADSAAAQRRVDVVLRRP